LRGHYNYYRDYDPQTGRFVESDPVGLLSGVNTYGYTRQSPIGFVDADGRFIVPVVTGIVGGVVGFAGNVGAQLFQNRGNWKCVKWGDAFIAGGVGAVAGALAPFVATGLPGAIGLGAASNLSQYGLIQAANGGPISVAGAAWAGISGAVGGWVGGAVPTGGALQYATNSPWLDPVIARQLNQASQAAAAIARGNIARTALGAIPSNLPLPDGSSDSECGCH